MLNKLKNKVLSGEKITVEEAEWLAGEADKEELYEAASVITREMASGHFDMCSIINAKSGRCPENCKWCAQSAYYRTETEVYGLVDKAECKRQALYNEVQGIARFSLVTSGRKPGKQDMQQLYETFEYIASCSDIKLCASSGDCPFFLSIALLHPYPARKDRNPVCRAPGGDGCVQRRYYRHG